MNELKPEDVMRALAWYEVVCENIGSVTVPSNELKAIAALLRNLTEQNLALGEVILKKDAEIAELKERVNFLRYVSDD